MKNNTDTDKNSTQRYIYVLIAVVLICIVGAIYKKKRMERTLHERALESAKRKLLTNEALTPSERNSLGQSSRFAPRPWKNEQEQKTALFGDFSNRPTRPVGDEITRERSEQSVKSFTQETFLKVEMPGSFNYTTLNTEDGFAGIYGEDSTQNAKLTGLAYNQVASPQQVAEFLKTDADSIPNIAQNPIQQMGSAQPLPPPSPDSGFSGGTVWNGRLANGESVAAVYIERADKKGSYLFVLSGPDAYFNNNDGSFDAVYEKAKALSPQQQQQQGR